MELPENHSPQRDLLANYVLDWVGMLPGKRESRRLVGDVILTEHDCHSDRNWTDAVAYAAWWIDLHTKGGVNNRQAPAERENLDARYRDYVRVAPFSIPLRAYYSRNVANLWMTGRVLSVSHVALGPVRVQLSLAAQGQAVGTAAATAIRSGLTPRQLADPRGPYIQPLRQLLLRQDVRILGVHNEDPDDLARSAVASASSSADLDLPDPERLSPDEVRWVPLDTDRAQTLPITADRVAAISVWLRNDTAAPVPLSLELRSVRRIWDRAHGRPVANGRAVVPAGHNGWVRVEVDAGTEPDRPHRVVLSATPGLSWAAANRAVPGLLAQYRTSSPGGVEPRNAHLECFSPEEVDLPAYDWWRQWRGGLHAVRLEPAPRPFEARFAINGSAWPDDLPNLWVSRPSLPRQPQWLRLDWPASVDVRTVQVSFDTNLDKGVHQRPGFDRPVECVRDWQVAVWDGGTWQTVHRETGNYLRHRVIHLEQAFTTTALRVEALATNAAPEQPSAARIYEVRVYAD